MKLTDMIDTLSTEVKSTKDLQATLEQKLKDLEAILNTAKTSIDSKITSLEAKESDAQSKIANALTLAKSMIATSTSIDTLSPVLKGLVEAKLATKDFLDALSSSLIAKDGIKSIVSIDKAMLDKALKDYVKANFGIEALKEDIFTLYKEDIDNAMKRRIRLEAKSVMDNYDFSTAIAQGFEAAVYKFLDTSKITRHAIKTNALLLSSQLASLDNTLENLKG
ncbi:hypothetical protein [Helicobacter sp. 11S02629-2]|uniref:hypothetical protein n=1 Tax=Helicobacter sp. 11S02629-2 TaxID=1476195 RepID=UPI000BA5E9A0|nr:hypothetical protein [Helicobacter sp. 11S02629-2]PAF42753.1 hypothetical protein BKH40_07615 [Helicobacter sp. 11S02629-2]